jgi:hypothetical protein
MQRATIAEQALEKLNSETEEARKGLEEELAEV